jgi:methionine--tRNA ligase beta chain
MTATEDEDIGTRYVIESGEEILCDDAGCPKGTTIIVRDLFYNTPARMKFLKKDVTEANAVAGVVDRIALSHPEVSIRFIREGKQVLITSGRGDLLTCVREVFGREFSDSLIPASAETNGVSVSGFVSRPSSARPNRNMQFFFINNRLIKTGTGSAALSEAYKNSIMVGKFPSCVLNISIDDFFKAKLAVGEILACEKVEKADRLLKSTVKIGDEVRTIVSGIAKFYTPEEMVGKRVVIVTNLEPRKIRGIESKGMILCACSGEHGSEDEKLCVITPEKLIESGAEVC